MIVFCKRLPEGNTPSQAAFDAKLGGTTPSTWSWRRRAARLRPEHMVLCPTDPVDRRSSVTWPLWDHLGDVLRVEDQIPSKSTHDPILCQFFRHLIILSSPFYLGIGKKQPKKTQDRQVPILVVGGSAEGS